MLDAFIRDGKIYWFSELTIESLKHEIERTEERIKQIGKNLTEEYKYIEDNKLELVDAQATLANLQRCLKMYKKQNKQEETSQK